MAPLPAEPFDPARLLQARADGRARVCVRRTLLRAGPLCRPPPAGAPVGHRRGGARRAAGGGPARGRHQEVRRDPGPGPLPGGPAAQARRAARATALAQARAAGTFTAAHQGYWDAARRQHGDAAGTRALIEVLLAHRTLPAAAVEAAMARATASGVLDAQAVLIDARRQRAGRSRRSSRSARWPATTARPRPWTPMTSC